MDTTLYQSQLSQALFDPTNATYSTTLIQTCMVLAVRAYRRWRQCLRPFGSGVTYSSATNGNTYVQVVGGPWTVGQSVTIQDSFNSETFTISSIIAGTALTNWMGTPLRLNLSGSLVNSYAAGVMVTSPTPGLSLISGTSFYNLPLDFVKFDQLTWDLANGTRASVRNYESFYDGAYTFSRMLSGIGWGQSQTFTGSWGAQGPSWVAGPSNGNVFTPPGSSTQNQTVYEIMPGNPPVLWINPAPGTSTLWQFNYYAAHQPETVPDVDFDAVLDAGRAVATQSIMQQYAGQLDASEKDVSEMPSHNTKALMDVAEQAMKQFDIKIRKRGGVFLMG